jgi:hypothetical protein
MIDQDLAEESKALGVTNIALDHSRRQNAPGVTRADALDRQNPLRQPMI